MTRSILRVSIAAILTILLLLIFIRHYAGEARVSAKVDLQRPLQRPDPVRLASPGRLEGQSDTIEVGAGIDGVVQTIHVKEGQTVAQGEPLAEIGCDDLRSAMSAAEAEAESLRQTRARLLRGSRDEERQGAEQQVAATRAVMDQTAAQLDRMTKLKEAMSVSKAAYEQALREYEVAVAELKRAERNRELVNAPPLPEEVKRADADILAASNKAVLASERLKKCTVRAPIAGTVLKAHLKEGESFALISPRPLFSMADLSGRRVRAEVDEHDIAKVHVGQKVSVACDAYPGKHFNGFVSRVAPSMGNKSVRTGDPADKADRDVLEVYAALEPAAVELPVGLRITVQFLD